VAGASVEWAVADAGDDHYLGTVNLFGFHSLDYRSAEVGFRTHPDARGRGVLTAALRLVLGHAFGSDDEGGLGLARVSLGAGDGNLASQGVALSAGFTATGRDRQCYDLLDGSIVDLVRFDILKSEFDARR
ncbi:MAG: GNAT family protein, partial [Nocardioidaceae bacterium]